MGVQSVENSIGVMSIMYSPLIHLDACWLVANPGHVGSDCWNKHCNNNSNSNSMSQDNVYGAVIVDCESLPGSSDECSTQRHVAADLWTKPISLSQ